MSHKIIAVVSDGRQDKLVLEKLPVLKYRKIDKSIVGTDGTFVEALYHSEPTREFKAFGGHEFEITMEDGEVVKCNGQWWNGITKDMLSDGLIEPNREVVQLGISTMEMFAKYKGFLAVGTTAYRDAIEALRQTYGGPVYTIKGFEDAARKGEVE